jgi:CRISPR-associated protein Cst1
MLRYTGHPLIDVGVATVTAFAGKNDPTRMTRDDLEAMARYIEDNYTRNPLRSFLTVAFTSNAWFAQDAYNPDKPGLTDEERQERRATRQRWADLHLRAWAAGPGGGDIQRCVFTGEVAVPGALSGKLLVGRAGRAQLPLLQGDDNINFYPGGESGVPISGTALLCLQAFPLGCAKVAGSLLAVHADDNQLTYRFARNNLQRNRAAVTLAQQNNDDKLPEERHALGTFLIGRLLELETERQRAVEDEESPTSITAYHLNNGKSPKLDLYFLPLQVTRFLRLATSAGHREEWDRLVKRGWQRPPEKKGRTAGASEPFEPRRNYLYEDILTLPDQAARFLRTYFLRAPWRRAFADDPRRSYSPLAEADLVSWTLTALFLKEVLLVDDVRIKEIRDLGDRLAAYVQAENDRRFFQVMMTETRYGDLRLALIRACAESVRRGRGPLITFDQFIEVFEDGEDLARPDWRLARDLVLIRMIEQLNQNGWLRGHAEALNTAVETLDASDSTVKASA